MGNLREFHTLEEGTILIPDWCCWSKDRLATEIVWRLEEEYEEKFDDIVNDIADKLDDKALQKFVGVWSNAMEAMDEYPKICTENIELAYQEAAKKCGYIIHLEWQNED